MSDLISRQDAIDAILILKHKPEFNSANSIRDCYVLTEAEEVIKHIPSAERKGKWVLTDGYRCSQCNHKLQTTGIPMYCPNCGLRMER